MVECRYDRELLDWKHSTANHDRVLLILALPTGLSHHCFALHQKRQALVLRKERLALPPILLVFHGYGGGAEDLGFWKGFDESANLIVQGPPGHDHQEACRVAETRKEDVREPIPSLVANWLSARLDSALDWIIHDANVQALAGDLAPDGGVAKGAAMVHVLQHIAISKPARSTGAEAVSKGGEVLLAGHDALKVNIHGYAELLAVACKYCLQIRSFSSDPGDKVFDLHSLAMLGRSHEHQLRPLFVD